MDIKILFMTVLKVVKRDGTIVDYNPEKIKIAIQKANTEVPRKEKCTKEMIDEIVKYIEENMIPDTK